MDAIENEVEKIKARVRDKGGSVVDELSSHWGIKVIISGLTHNQMKEISRDFKYWEASVLNRLNEEGKLKQFVREGFETDSITDGLI